MLILSYVLAVLAYLILAWGILYRGKVQPLSATLLWFSLDSLAAYTAYASGGNWLLAAGYATGCSIAAAATLYRGKVVFARSDGWVTALVVVCVVVWLGVGDVAGLVASSLATFIAGLPVIFHYRRRPRNGQLSVWLLYTTANLLALLGREGNNLEDWIFPAFGIVGSGWVLVILFSRLRRGRQGRQKRLRSMR